MTNKSKLVLDATYIKHVRDLIDEAQTRLGVQNDAKLSMKLEVAPPVISKIRNGKLALGPSLILRIHEKTGITMAEIKSILSFAIYSQIVWIRPASDFRVPDLWPGQVPAVNQAKSFLRNDGFAVLRMGMRSGKTVMAAKIMEDLGYEHICIYASSVDIAIETYKHIPYVNTHHSVHYNELPPKYDNPKRVLVVLEDAFWTFGAHEKFQTFRRLGFNVLALGSRGPEWDNIPFWRTLHNSVSRSTWEVNPNVTRSSLQPQYDEDAAKSRRDYEAF